MDVQLEVSPGEWEKLQEETGGNARAALAESEDFLQRVAQSASGYTLYVGPSSALRAALAFAAAGDDRCFDEADKLTDRVLDSIRADIARQYHTARAAQVDAKGVLR